MFYLKKIFFYALLLSLISVNMISCTPVDSGAGIKETAKLPESLRDPCLDMVCDENYLCSEGLCICKPGFFLCNDGCIEDSICCNDTDCDTAELCENGECIKKCADLECESNKYCDENQECTCGEKRTWCSFQEKCIDRSACCTNWNCPEDEICLVEIASIQFCVQDISVGCKYLPELFPKDFETSESRYEVTFMKILPEDMAIVKIKDNILTLEKNVHYAFEDVLIYFDDHKISGGRCEEE